MPSNPLRVSSTAGRHIVHHNPLSKGSACHCCKLRKVRCSGTTPACKACMRTARFEGRDPELVVCQYGGKKCGVRSGRKNKGKGKEVRVAMEDEQEHHPESTEEGMAEFANERLLQLQLDLRAALIPDSTSHPLYFPLPPSRASSSSSSCSEMSSLSTSPSSISSSTSSFPSLSMPQTGPAPAASYASQLPAQFDYTSFLSTFSPSQLSPPLPTFQTLSSASPSTYPSHLPSIAIPSTGGSLFASSPSTLPSTLLPSPQTHSYPSLPPPPTYPLPTTYALPSTTPIYVPSLLSPSFPPSFGTAGTYFGSPSSYFSPRAIVGAVPDLGGAPLFGAKTWEAVLGGEKGREKEPWGWGGGAEGGWGTEGW